MGFLRGNAAWADRRLRPGPEREQDPCGRTERLKHPWAGSGGWCPVDPLAHACREWMWLLLPCSWSFSGGWWPEALAGAGCCGVSLGGCPTWMFQAHTCSPWSSWVCKQLSQGEGFREETVSPSVFRGPCRGPMKSKPYSQYPEMLFALPM